MNELSKIHRLLSSEEESNKKLAHEILRGANFSETLISVIQEAINIPLNYEVHQFFWKDIEKLRRVIHRMVKENIRENILETAFLEKDYVIPGQKIERSNMYLLENMYLSPVHNVTYQFLTYREDQKSLNLNETQYARLQGKLVLNSDKKRLNFDLFVVLRVYKSSTGRKTFNSSNVIVYPDFILQSIPTALNPKEDNDWRE